MMYNVPEDAAKSPIVTTFYEALFSFVNGNRSNPSLMAGIKFRVTKYR